MKNKIAKKYSSTIIKSLLNEITPQQKLQTNAKMLIAARLDELIKAKRLTKGDFAAMLGKSPSEVTKWLSGTHNFTIDTLAEIALVLNKSIIELFEPGQLPKVNGADITINAKSEHMGIKYITPLSTPYKSIGIN